MAVSHANGTVTFAAADTVGTTKVLTLGFQMKAMRVTWVGRSEATDASGRATSYYGHGFGTSTTVRSCIGCKNIDNAAATDANFAKRIDALVVTCDNATTNTADGLIDISAVDGTTVTLIVDDQLPVDLAIQWEAWGGADITNATVIEETVNTTTPGATFNVTGVGFQGTIAFLIGSDTVTLGNIAISDRCGISFGAFVASGTDCGLAGMMTDDGSATADTWSYCRAGESLIYFPAAMANSPDCRAKLSSWTSDGFDMQCIENARNNRRFFALVIQGGSWSIGNFNSLNTTGTIQKSGFGFVPAGVNVHSSCVAQSTVNVATNDSAASHGVASKGGGQSAQSVLDENGTANEEVTTAIDYDKVYINLDLTSAVEGLISVQSFDTDGITFSQDDADPSAAFVWYVACGPYGATFTQNSDINLLVGLSKFVHPGSNIIRG